MAYTAAEPLLEAKVLLNDPSGTIYPDEKLIPLMQKAYRELQTQLILNGVPVVKEFTMGTAIPVPIGTISLGDGSGLPNDLVYPIELTERAAGSTVSASLMYEKAWDQNAAPGTSLSNWNWREETIYFLGATQDREVFIKYMKGLTRISDATSPIEVMNATTYLAARTAAIAAFVLGANPSRADGLNNDAGSSLEALLRYMVKRQQGLPIRRAVNRYRR